MEQEMTAHELLNVLNKRVIKGTIPGEDLVQDLNELLQRFDDANYCRIIRRALEWAAIYDSQDKCERWGGRDEVKALLIQDIGIAAGVAAKLER
jgi:hypothetical protein